MVAASKRAKDDAFVLAINFMLLSGVTNSFQNVP